MKPDLELRFGGVIGAAAGLVTVAILLGACTSQPIAQDPDRQATIPPAPSVPMTIPPASSVPSTLGPISSTTVPNCSVEEPVLADNPWSVVAASALDHSGFDGLEVSASIWVMGVGEVVAHNPDLKLFPASNQKIFTAVGALRLLDPEFTFRTTIELVDDDLVFRASGDPTLTARGPNSLVELARQVVSRHSVGVERLVIDAGRFEPNTTLAGRQDWQVPTYTGPLSAFLVDDNRWRKDDDYVNNPALENGQLLAEKLGAVGVAVSQALRRDNYPDSGPELAAVESPPVSELIRSMLHSSDNEIAESLLRQIGNGSTATGIQAVDKSLAGQCPAIGGDSGDGSGLSRANLRSSRDWRQLLQFATGTDWGQALFDDLPVAGQSGTMSNRLTGSATAGNVRAKTGTIIGGRALSGYGQTPDGRPVIFSIITNGEPSAAHRSIEAIDNLVTKIVSTSG